MHQHTHTPIHQAIRATVRATFSTAAVVGIFYALHLPSIFTGPM